MADEECWAQPREEHGIWYADWIYWLLPVYLSHTTIKIIRLDRCVYHPIDMLLDKRYLLLSFSLIYPIRPRFKVFLLHVLIFSFVLIYPCVRRSSSRNILVPVSVAKCGEEKVAVLRVSQYGWLVRQIQNTGQEIRCCARNCEEDTVSRRAR